ncbi:ketopantoate reductase PanE/ApbA C terminal-domain-containing protein [Roridomyces roridus]|uniref:2-dehydropantoate 2-reductase n=1 Tax=Roridomyces roridus TaxID=1738132 RepID=A0AAD7CCU6_9AGAR|nr:ketopantoate reductase PanE/ApbA C terminal-domain-containing protein [Roridomyces roridus]
MLFATALILIGLFSLGSIYAFILKAGGQVRVSVVARSNALVLKEKGLSLRSRKFGNHDGVKFHAVFTDCNEAAKSGISFAYVVCVNKAILDSTPSMEDMLQPVIGPDTVIVLIQNGVGQEVSLREAFPKTTIIASVSWTGGTILDVGLVELFTKSDTLVLGVEWDENIPRERQQKHLDTFTDILKKSNAKFTVKEDIQQERWVKVIWNAVWNSLTALTRIRTSDFLMTSPAAKSVAESIVVETMNVAKARGIILPENTLEEMMQKYTTLKGSHSSMLVDALNMKQTEVEAIIGYPLREGIRLGVPTPTLNVIYALLKAMDWKHANPEAARLDSCT